MPLHEHLRALIKDARLDLLIDLEHTVVRTFLEEAEGMEDKMTAAKLLTQVVLNMEECFSPKSESPDFV